MAADYHRPMKPPPPLAAVRLVDQVPRPECIAVPGEMPKLEPRPMPQLAEPSGVQCHRMPLWRVYEKLGG